MTIEYPITTNDVLSVELNPATYRDPESKAVLAIADWLWQEYGIETDCDAIVITLLWMPTAEEGRQASPQAVES